MTANSDYIVQPGDTLSQIALKHNLRVEDLTTWNEIPNPALIRPGQRIALVRPGDANERDFFSELWIRFIDPNGAAIAGLRATVVAGSQVHEHVTDAHGTLPPVHTVLRSEKIHVHVHKLGGGEKKVAELSPPAGVHQATLRSPRARQTIPLRVHQGGADHHEADALRLLPGQTQHNRDSQGQPVVNVGVECPNKENLRLGLNVKYRDFIVAAAKQSGILAQGIAAFCEAEASKLSIPKIGKDGKPVKRKNGKMVMIRTSEWNPDSYNEGGAGGLTQFLPGTWLMVSNVDGSFLKQKVAAKIASNGGKKPSKSEILEMRKDPEAAIMTAGDYATMNLRALQSKGLKIEKVADVDLAKLAYAAHHEGAGGLNRIAQGTLSDEDAESLLAAQFRTKHSDGTAEAQAYEKKVGLTGADAYKKFLFDYIDAKIAPMSFACDASKLKTPKGIEDILKEIKG